ncbi:MAG TPA: hypothetical protein ACFYEA_02860 [Candidatus Tripitaka californicus]|uniref:hypothetical protein n=1 Tax=Candidatus Tripitaka californicus TaxID=3367616 RepID=UPI00402946C7
MGRLSNISGKEAVKAFQKVGWGRNNDKRPERGGVGGVILEIIKNCTKLFKTRIIKFIRKHHSF